MWLNAMDPICVKIQPENGGWFLDGYLKPVGFIGDHIPYRIEDIVVKTDAESDVQECSEVGDHNLCPMTRILNN